MTMVPASPDQQRKTHTQETVAGQAWRGAPCNSGPRKRKLEGVLPKVRPQAWNRVFRIEGDLGVPGWLRTARRVSCRVYLE